MWPRKKFWWELPQQSPNPEARIPAGDPMHKWQLGMMMPTVPLKTFDEWDLRYGGREDRLGFSADTSDTYPNTGPPGLGDISQTPQYDHTMGAGAGTAPTPFTRRKGGFKRVLKHLAAMESPGPDWSLEAKKSGVPSPWSPTNVAWSPVGGTMLDWKKKRTA